MFFTRTECSREDAQSALERGRSIRRWSHMGCSPWEHLAMSVTAEERIEALQKLGYDVYTDEEAESIVWGELFEADVDDAIIEALGLEPFGNGYAQYLPGLCALESFEDEPSPEDCTVTLDGASFGWLVCYEGEFAGYDPDDDWELYRPTRIVWAVPTQATGQRVCELD